MQSQIRIIDADTHLTEPHDLWTTRAPPAWRDRVPQVRTVDGKPHWVLDGKEIMGTTRASSVIYPNGSKATGWAGMSLTLEQVHKASWDIKARVEMLKDVGIWAQILYPNLLGFGGNRIPTTDPALKTMSVKIYNDAMAEYQEQSGQRLFGMGILPWWNVQEAVEEAKRIKGLGLRGVNTNPNPQEQGLPDLGHDHWRPMLETLSELELPINFHIGGSEDQQSFWGDAAWTSQHDDLKLAVGSTTLYLYNAKVIANLIMGGLCERYPKLKFVSVESGIGWIPFVLESLDYNASDITPEVARRFTMKPSEYFRRQFYACFWFERNNIAESIRQVGEDNVLFETDFPHVTCLYPDSAAYAMKSLHGVDPVVREKALSLNAAKLYKIPLPTEAT